MGEMTMLRIDTFGGLLAVVVLTALALYFFATVILPIFRWIFVSSL